MPDVLRSIDEKQRFYDRRIKEIFDDLTRSEQWKMEEAERLVVETRTAITEAVEAERKEKEMAVRAARRLAMGPPKVPGQKDPAMAALSYRDALDRVEKVKTEAELEEILQKAELTADEYLANACLTRAYALGSSRLVGKVLEFRSELTALYQDFLDQAEDLNEWTRQQGLWGTPGRLRKPQEYRA